MKSRLKITTEITATTLLKYQNIALFAHTRPDGDTIGACVALCFILEKLGKHARVFCDTKLDGAFDYFEETAIVRNGFDGEKYDLFVAVDCADIYRLGVFSGIFDAFSETLCIDHHNGELFAKYNCVYDCSSCAEIVYKIAKALGVDVDATIATYLYMGLCTDTGNFANTNTNAQSFYIAGELLEKGAFTDKVNCMFFKQTSLAKTKLMAKALGRMRSYFDGRLMIVYTTKQELDEYFLPFSATESFVQHTININTAIIGVSLAEHAKNVYKVSMRGKDFDVRQICTEFGGGGHINASGCMIQGYFEDVVEKIVNTVERYL